MTTSSMRMGCVIAIWIPASSVVRLFCAAKPITMPATPADASMAVPNCRTEWKTMSIEASANNAMTDTAIFLSTVTCV
jgi:hypothetical protein